MPTVKDLLTSVSNRADHIYEKLKEAVNVLGSILEQLGGDPEEAVDSIIANYPRTGKRDLPIGIITIDTRRWKALFPDGTAEDMSASIPDQVCRSILIYANAEIDLILLDEDKINLSSTIFPSWLRIDKIEFDTIKITTTEITTVYISVSNIETPIIEAVSEYSNKTSWTHGQMNITAAGTAEQMAALAIPDGFFFMIKGKPGNLGNIYAGNTQANAEDHTAALTIQPNEVLRLRINDADVVWLDADNNAEGIEYTVESG